MYDKSAQFHSPSGDDRDEIQMLRTERDVALRKLSSALEREQRIMRALNITNPERLEHDLRNVLNELSLLRALFNDSSREGRLSMELPDRSA